LSFKAFLREVATEIVLGCVDLLEESVMVEL